MYSSPNDSGNLGWAAAQQYAADRLEYEKMLETAKAANPKATGIMVDGEGNFYGYEGRAYGLPIPCTEIMSLRPEPGQYDDARCPF
jgi:hypothetical protein